jgi:hypothetical protein
MMVKFNVKMIQSFMRDRGESISSRGATRIMQSFGTEVRDSTDSAFPFKIEMFVDGTDKLNNNKDEEEGKIDSKTHHFSINNQL